MISPAQKEILQVLIELYEKNKTNVKAEEIAERISRNPGTIRNQMQILNALGFIVGIPGPMGGYRPALKAFDALKISPSNSLVNVPVYLNGKYDPSYSVREIKFPGVEDPTQCEAVITLRGDTTKIKSGTEIKIGPTPINRIILTGIVIGRDDIEMEVLVKTKSIIGLPRIKMEEFIDDDLIVMSRDTSIRECAKILSENSIVGAPVVENGKLVGIITIADIVKAIAKGDISGTIEPFIVKNVLTIDKKKTLIDCIREMAHYDVGRLIIVTGKENKPLGIVTRTDILSLFLD